MRRTNPSRPIAIARRADDVRPDSMLAALGVVTLLMLMWTALVL
jgi:hypothetical protein